MQLSFKSISIKQNEVLLTLMDVKRGSSRDPFRVILFCHGRTVFVNILGGTKGLDCCKMHWHILNHLIISAIV